MKLKTLAPRLRPASTARLPVLTVQPGRVERKRGSAGVKDRNRIRARDNGVCQLCGALGFPVDHIVPLEQGGTDDDSNKQTLCQPCHDAKTAREAAQRAGRY